MKFLHFILFLTSVINAQNAKTSEIIITVNVRKEILLNDTPVALHQIPVYINHIYSKLDDVNRIKLRPIIEAPANTPYVLIDKIKTQLGIARLHKAMYRVLNDDKLNPWYGGYALYTLEIPSKKYTSKEWLTLKKKKDSINTVTIKSYGKDPINSFFEQTYNWRLDLKPAIYSLQQDLILNVLKNRKVKCIEFNNKNLDEIISAHNNYEVIILSYNESLSFNDYNLLIKRLREKEIELSNKNVIVPIIEISKELEFFHNKEGIYICK